ncbi:MAG: ABC transporter substrate-binding protein, partial [Nitriliruptorales bacterium]|nr:ABC transporter substrate-binding protein [Nitriliruptorales bacterium]
DQDQEQARQLLAGAGAEDLSMGLMVTDEFPETVQAAQVIAAQLGEVGIDVGIEVEEFSAWLDRQTQGDWEGLMLGWIGNIDPADFYDSQHLCDASNNYQGYCSSETDDLLGQASTETDQDARKELYDQAVQQIVEDNSYLYLYNPDVVEAWSPDLEGYTIRPDRAINFETVQLGG